MSYQFAHFCDTCKPLVRHHHVSPPFGLVYSKRSRPYKIGEVHPDPSPTVWRGRSTVMPWCMVRREEAMRNLISSRMRQVQSVRCIACLPTARLCIVSSMAYRHLPANREALHLHRQGCNRKSCPARVYNNGTSCMSRIRLQAEYVSENASNTGARLCRPKCCQSSFQSLPQVVCPNGQTCTRSPAWAS